jgi:amidase
MKLSEYATYDAMGLADLIKSGEVAAPEVRDCALRAIDAVNGDINAVIETYDDPVPAPSDTPSDAPFSGVPYLIKDVGAHFGGLKCEFCSRLCEGMVAAEDSHYAGLVRRSGVSIVGRTNTPEFSMSGTSENVLYGNTSTPWKKGYSSSGSSGGSAAAVAAGIVPIAHGSDIGGSIRGPAAWCGGVGLKPSRGRISSGPNYDEWGHGMSMSFVQTKTMRDTATMLDHLAVPQPGDPFVIARAPNPCTTYLNGPAKPLKLAFSAAPLMDAPVDPEVAEAVRATAKALQDLGHDVTEDAPPVDIEAIDDACLTIWFQDFHGRLDGYGEEMGRTVNAATVEAGTLRFYEYAKQMTDTDFFKAMDTFNRVRRQTGAFFAQYDAWITPTMAQVAPQHGIYGMDVDLAPREFLRHEQRPCQYMVLYNLTGQPALSLPLAMHSSGLPIGVQIAARPAEEHILIALGAALEDAMPWRDRRPPIHVSLVE